MKFSLWTQFGALNSSLIFEAFAQGCKLLGHEVVYNDSNSDVDVIWSVLFNGRMLGNYGIWKTARSMHKPVVILEVGTLQRNATWKVGINGVDKHAYVKSSKDDSTRAKLLGLEFKSWNTNGEYILICGQHNKSLLWHGQPTMSTWIQNTIINLRAVTDRPILIRPHPRCPVAKFDHLFKHVHWQLPQKLKNTYDTYDISFENIWTTISWNGTCGIHSILNGVPAIVGPSSLASDVSSQNLRSIETPLYSLRQQWVNNLAYTEWTTEEIAQGIPLARLTNTCKLL